MRRLTEEKIEEISYMIDDVGLDEFVACGDAEEILRGTSMESVLIRHIDARNELVLGLRELGIDV